MPGLVAKRQLGQVGVDKTVFAQRRVGFSASDDFVHRSYGAALFELDSFQRCDLTRVEKLFSFGEDCEANQRCINVGMTRSANRRIFLRAISCGMPPK